MLQTRTATRNDAPLITAHREAMFHAIGRNAPDTLKQMSAHFEPWLTRMLTEGRYTGWIIEETAQNPHRPIASAGFLLIDWPPHPLDPTSEHRAYMLNVYVDPEYRSRGLAHSLIELALAEARKRKIRVTSLHASDAARSIYESYGFQSTNEMHFINKTFNGEL